MPKLVYLDHSLVSHDSSWPSLDRLLNDPAYQLALSFWNLVEIAAASDVAQRRARIEFLAGLKPAWLLDHVYVRKQEVRRFLWPRRFSAPAEEVHAVAPHLSQAQAVYAGAKARIGVTMEAVVAELAKHDFNREKTLAPRALSFLQQVPKQDWKKHQRDIFVAVMAAVVPEVDPAGRLLRKTEKQALIDYCWDNRADFMGACPTMAIDDALCEARINHRNRKPQPSDGVDLGHAVMALGYSDYFIVRDRFVATCARQAQSRLSGLSLARVVADPADLPLTPSPPAAS